MMEVALLHHIKISDTILSDPQLIIHFNVAGAGGFEPPNAGTKILCLTT